MLAPILGVPTERLTDLVHSTAAALTAAGLSTDVITSYSLRDISVHLLQRTSAATLVILPSPNPDWHGVLRAATEGFVYMHTETTALASFTSPSALTLEGSQRFVETVRTWTRSLTSFVELQGPSCLVIDVDRPDAGALFLRHLEARLGSSAEIDPPMPGRQSSTANSAGEDVSLDVAGKAVLLPFDALRHGSGPGTIVTHADLFFDGTRGAVLVTESVSVPREPANLFFGPYFYFPAGIWRVRTSIHLSPELAGRSFVMDVVTALGTKVATASTYSLEVGGDRELSLEFRHQDWHAPVEVRFHCATPGESGKLTLHRVEFIPLEPSPGPPAA